ncbi:MAG: SRPBCC family protein [Sciscionella sp.]
MSPITVSTEVDRPAEKVFAYATDPAFFHEWQKGVTGGRADQPGTPAVGGKCVTTRRIGFADRPTTSEITRRDPPRAWAVRGIDGPIRATVDVSVQSLAENRSRLTITVDFEGHGIGKVLIPLVVGPQARKEMPANLAALKARLETEAA